MSATEAPHDGPQGVPEEAAHALPLDRAEEVLDRLGQQFGALANRTGRGFFRALARAREEAEDMWAEAQSIRQNNHTDHH